MNQEEKKAVSMNKKLILQQTGVIGLYICSGISLVCGIFMAWYSVSYVMDYYQSYGMSVTEGMSDALQYVLSSSGGCFGFAVVFVSAGIMLQKLYRTETDNGKHIGEHADTIQSSADPRVQRRAGSHCTNWQSCRKRYSNFASSSCSHIRKRRQRRSFKTPAMQLKQYQP